MTERFTGADKFVRVFLGRLILNGDETSKVEVGVLFKGIEIWLLWTNRCGHRRVSARVTRLVRSKRANNTENRREEINCK